jgi:hypothetical protein
VDVLLFLLAACVALDQHPNNKPTNQTTSTLTTSGAVCLDKFTMLTKTHYKDDADCAALIKAALSTSDLAKCPQGSRERSGSAVQKCMSKSEVRERCCVCVRVWHGTGGGGGKFLTADGHKQTKHNPNHPQPNPITNKRPSAARGSTLCARAR